jgi:hypothetical protein
LALLTAIIPIGVNHRRNSLISSWQNIANKYSTELKVVIVEDLQSSQNIEPQPKLLFFNLSNSETLVGNFNSPGISRNIGLERVESPWVCFWDSDDIPEISNFIQMVKEADASKYELAIGKFNKFSIANNINYTSQKKPDLNSVVNELGIWRMSFRTDSLANLKFESLSMAEDQLFLLDYVFYNKKTLYFQKVVYNYQIQSPLQLTNSNSVNEIALFLHYINSRLVNNQFSLNKYSIKIVTKLILTGLFRANLEFKIKIYFECAKILINKPYFAIMLFICSPLAIFNLFLNKIMLLNRTRNERAK